MIPPVSPAEIAAVLLAELLFGIGFNAFVAWEIKHPLWPMAANVVIGTAVTVLMPTLTWMRVSLDFWQAACLLTACFAASGLPMFFGSAKRTVESHKRRPLPNWVTQRWDDAAMDLSALADQVANQRVDSAQIVHNLHQIIGMLKVRQ